MMELSSTRRAAVGSPSTVHDRMSSSSAIKRGRTYGRESSARKKARLGESSSFDILTPPSSDTLPPSSPSRLSDACLSRHSPTMTASLLATTSASTSLSSSLLEITPQPSSQPATPSRSSTNKSLKRSSLPRLGSITNTVPTSPTRAGPRASASPPPPPSKQKTKLLPIPPKPPSFTKPKPKASSQGTLRSFFQTTILPSAKSSPTAARSRPPSSSSPAPSASLQQTHLLPLPPIRTCQKCQMTYQPHSPPDELAHSKHHKGVVDGLEWAIPDAAEGARVVLDGIQFGRGKTKGVGRVVCVDGNVGEKKGKLATKMTTLHSLIDTHLSAPSLPPHILHQTKTFVLLSTPTAKTKELVLGACVVQQITTALRVLPRAEVSSRKTAGEALVLVEADVTSTDNEGGVFCDPLPIPTSLGIHRIHTSTSHQRQGVASILLDAACRYGIYGMEVKKEIDGVAFSQPTQSGQALMNGWGKGLVRVFVEDP